MPRTGLIPIKLMFQYYNLNLQGVITQIYKAEFHLNTLSEVRDLQIIMDSEFHIKRGGSVVYQLN